MDDRPPAPRGAAPFVWALFAMSLGGAQGLAGPWLGSLLGVESDRHWTPPVRLRLHLLYAAVMLVGSLWGLVADARVLGRRRERQLLVPAVLGMIAWIAGDPPSDVIPMVAILLALAIAGGLGIGACVGALTELGQARASTGRMGAVYLLAAAAGRLALIPVWYVVAGWSRTHLAATGVAAWATVALGVRFLRGIAAPPPAAAAPASAAPPRPRSFWRVCAVVACGLAPLSLHAALAERLSVVAPPTGGWDVITADHVGVVVGAGAYFVLCRRFALAKLLPLCLLLQAAALPLLALVGVDPTLATGCALACAVVRGLGSCALVDLSMRAATPGREALSVMLCLGLPGAAWQLLTALATPLTESTATLPLAGLGAALAVLAALSPRLLPAALARGRDGEAHRRS